MPSVLSDKRICHPFVPQRWQPVLEDLMAFQDLERALRERPDDDALLLHIDQLHQRLVEGSVALLEPHVLDDLTSEQLHRMFARAVFLLMRIASSVAGDDELLDTAGCRTLHLYEADFLADPGHQEQLRDALIRSTLLNEAELDQIEACVFEDTRQAVRKHDIVRAIRDEFSLWSDSEDLRSDIFRFFETLYPNVGIVAEEIELIVTGTMIFFCLPFAKDRLTTSRFEQLTVEEQQPIRDFLTRANRFSQYQFSHFPVFGFLRGQDLNEQLLRQVAGRSGYSVDEVAKELSTLTAIVPITELDKYVVHDIWGHSWQACMLGFDDMYVELADYADPLTLQEQARSPHEGERRFVDCFTGTGYDLKLDEDCLRRFINLEVAERLPVAMTPVLAEVLADVAEFKLLATGRTESLASSSALKMFPAKLDLTLRDVSFYFRQATKVFRLWAKQGKRQQATIDELVRMGASEDAATAAVHEAVALWKQMEADWMAPTPRFEEAGEMLCVNVVSRLALNFLAIHRETLLTYQRLEELDVGDLPLKGFRDLLLITVAVFFEAAPSMNLWRVDEFLSTKMEPLCLALAAASRDG